MSAKSVLHHWNTGGQRYDEEAEKTAAEQANQALANGEITQSQYDALQREIIETEQKLKDLERQTENSSVALQKIGQVGDNLQAVGDKVSGVGETLTKSVTAPVVGLGTAAVATAASFESSMSQVQATMGITKDAVSTVNRESVNTMDTLSALAKQMLCWKIAASCRTTSPTAPPLTQSWTSCSGRSRW